MTVDLTETYYAEKRIKCGSKNVLLKELSVKHIFAAGSAVSA